jgi:hypothetical protein
VGLTHCFIKRNPAFCVCYGLALGGDSGLKLSDLFVQLQPARVWYFPDSIEKLYSVIRPAAQSSYIRENKACRPRLSASPSASVLRPAASLRRPVPCQLAFSRLLHQFPLRHAAPAQTSIADGRGHRRKAHHSGYSAWSIGVCPARTCYNGNGRKAYCSACSPRRTATSRNPHILPARKKSVSYRPCTSCGGLLSAPAPD